MKKQEGTPIRSDEPLTVERRQQLEAMIRGMRSTSSDFYRRAISVGNHAFIEFTGLMNEYVKYCEDALEAGVDFADTNVHTGRPLVTMKDYMGAYLGEKFGCIFSTSFGGDHAAIDAFCREAFALSGPDLRPAATEE